MTANRNGDDFIAEKLREALSGYLGQRLDPTTVVSVRDRVVANLPNGFTGTVDVKQDATDPTKVNVTLTTPLSYLTGTYVVGPASGVRYTRGGGADDTYWGWLRAVARTSQNPAKGLGFMGFRAYLPGRAPR